MKSRAGLYLWVVLLAALLAVGAGCSKAPDDSQISSQVQEKFKTDSGLQDKAITVQAENGVVTLSGVVENDAQRTAAARYASSISGVTKVVDNLELASSGRVAHSAKQTARAMKSDEPPRRTPKPKPGKASSHSQAVKDDSGDDVSTTKSAPAMAAVKGAPPTPESVAAPPAASPNSTPAPPPPPKKATIPSGTTMAIRLVDELDSETAQQGQTFKATLDSPLSSEGDVAIPTGYEVQGHVVEVQSAGKFAGKSLLTLQLDRISVGGKSYSLQTDQYHREGSSRGKNTAEKVGAGAAIGAIIGGIAGGGKGAGIGAAAGGGLGGGVQAATKGKQIKLPSETVLNFTLQSPLTVTVADGPNAKRPKLDTPQ